MLSVAWETKNTFENVMPYRQSGLKETEIGRNEERLSDFRGSESKQNKTKQETWGGLTNLLGYKYVLTFKYEEESPQGQSHRYKGRSPRAGPCRRSRGQSTNPQRIIPRP